MALNINVKADLINASTKASLSRVAQRQAFQESLRDKRTQERATKERKRNQQSAQAADESNSSPKTKSLANKRVQEQPAARRRGEQVKFVYGYLSSFTADGSNVFRLWSPNAVYFEKIAFSSNTYSSEALDPPTGPSTWTESNGYNTTPPTSVPYNIPSYTPVYTQSNFSRKTESVIRSYVVPVGGSVGMLILLKSVQRSSGTTSYRSERKVTKVDGVPYKLPFQSSGSVPVSDEEVDRRGGPDWSLTEPNGFVYFFKYYTNTTEDGWHVEIRGPKTSLDLYNTRVFFEYSWEGIGSTTSSSLTYETEAYLFSSIGIRKISTPQSLASAIQSLDNVQPLERSQGIGVEGQSLASQYIGSPRTLQALITQTPDSWSTKWLQFREKAPGSGTRSGFFITDLDPTTKRPVDLNSGRPLFGVSMPTNPPANIFESSDPSYQYYDLLVAWDWGRPDLCKQALLSLGFSEQDLVP